MLNAVFAGFINIFKSGTNVVYKITCCAVFSEKIMSKQKTISRSIETHDRLGLKNIAVSDAPGWLP